MTLQGIPDGVIQNSNPISIVTIIPSSTTSSILTSGRWGSTSPPSSASTPVSPQLLLPRCMPPFPQPGSNQRLGHFWTYILVGIAEISTSVTSLEYAFAESPKQMKSFVVAFFQSPALAAALNFAIISVDVGYRFAWLFGSFPVTTMVIGMPFCSTFLKLDGAEAVLNSIRSGDRDGFKDVHKPRVLMCKPDLSCTHSPTRLVFFYFLYVLVEPVTRRFPVGDMGL